MKKIFLTLFLTSAVLLLSGPTAYLASNPEGLMMRTPIAPIGGRKTEVNFYSMLNNSGREYQSWIKSGRTYIKRKEYEQAILAIRKAIKLRPAAEEARFLLAWTYEKRGLEGLPGDMTNWDDLAVKEYTAAIELADHLPSRFNLAVLHRRNERFVEARRHLEHILIINSNGALGKKAATELTSIFEQNVRPEAISSNIRDAYRHE